MPVNDPPAPLPGLPAAPEESHDEPSADGPDFPVVGVGASAGGLEAFTQLLQAVPRDPGMALLFVQHLDPHHKSQLPEILAPVTELPVQEVTEGMTVRVNHIYLIPPNTNMAVADGHMTLTPRSAMPGQHMPIDHLFRSLAAIHGNRSIGVILSGGGSDGTLGFQAIKGEGGVTFAQDEATARQLSMPRSAILSGCADYVLPPKEIAAKLVQLASHPYVSGGETPAIALADVLADILALIRTSTGVDFGHYKHTTIRRRVLRRMALLGITEPRDYLRFLEHDRKEVQHLYQDFLIRVTQFFRDPEAFHYLAERVFPALVENRAADTPIRIWVAGCASGEEAYSVAISLLEFLDSRGLNFPVKILATDLNESALEHARAGIYVDNIEIDVSADRLRRFFMRVDGNYQIRNSVRELCVFSRHHLGNDPPFSHLDLLCCRNVLIYMDGSLQRRVLPTFYYALNPGGYLFLGPSESIGKFGDLFAATDANQRIFVKRPGATIVPLDFSRQRATDLAARSGERAPGVQSWTALDVQKEADRIVLQRYAPVGVVVDESANVLQFRGRTGAYLEPAPGLATLDLFRMLREGLLADVRAAFNQARTENSAVVREVVRAVDGQEKQHTFVEALPFKVPPTGTRFFLLLFHDHHPSAPARPTLPETRAAPPDREVAQLEQDLAALREYLQSVIEEQESTNEELKSANEEILSANEELQSTNEELQTAKEEAQSANEELATVNDELRHRNFELNRVNNDLMNLLWGMNIPIVMVSRDLRIRRFTPPAEKLFNLIPTDIGRRISDIKPNPDVADLPGLIATVIDSVTQHEGQIRDLAGHWHLLRIRPYITQDGKIDGASIVLLDIDAVKALPAVATAPS